MMIILEIVNVLLLIFLMCMIVAILIGAVTFWGSVIAAIWQGIKEWRK